MYLVLGLSLMQGFEEKPQDHLESQGPWLGGPAKGSEWKPPALGVSASTSWPGGLGPTKLQVCVGSGETQVHLCANTFSAHGLHPCKVYNY